MRIKPSICFVSLLLLLHVFAATVVVATDADYVVKMVLIYAVLLSLFYSVAHHILLLLPGSLHEILVDDGGMSAITQDENRFSIHAENSTVVTPQFTVFCALQDKQRIPTYQVVFADALGKGEYRDFCTHLKTINN